MSDLVGNPEDRFSRVEAQIWNSGYRCLLAQFGPEFIRMKNIAPNHRHRLVVTGFREHE